MNSEIFIQGAGGNNNYVLQVGDLIRVDRRLYQHIGLYVGPHGFSGGDVLHNDKMSGAVVLCSLADFSGGLPIYLHREGPKDLLGRLTIAHRALALIGQKCDLPAFTVELPVRDDQPAKFESAMDIWFRKFSPCPS